MLVKMTWGPSPNTRRLSSRSKHISFKAVELKFINYTYSFSEVLTKITGNGGKIVGLDEPKLTHVVVDKLDTTRRVKLMERTSQWVFLDFD